MEPKTFGTLKMIIWIAASVALTYFLSKLLLGHIFVTTGMGAVGIVVVMAAVIFPISLFIVNKLICCIKKKK
ncbi:hypothetical protein ABXS75_16160 [Roseburia hominis]